MQSETVSYCEIEAYIDGELDLARRLAVEDYLSRNQDAAGRVIADLRARTALRLSQQIDEMPSAELLGAAARVSERLSAPVHPMRFFFSRGRSLAAATVATFAIGVVGLVWAPNAQASPRYVSDALMAFRVGLLRTEMPSQIESRVFDSSDVRRTTSIRVPVLPATWRITDVQLFPSEEGPALQIMVRTNDQKTVSIFAVRSTAAAPAKPVTVRRGEVSVAYWRNGDIAYALTGLDAPDALDLAAEDLADNRLH